MTDHKTGTREEWLAARLELLDAEKELTRRSDQLARRRQELPWVPIEKDYRFETEDGTKSLTDLFDGRSQLLVYHFMFGFGYRVDEQNPGCTGCSFVADHFDGVIPHLNGHDVTLVAESIAPLGELRPYKERMGWRFPWVSSLGSDFKYDFGAAFTEEQQRNGAEYNFRHVDQPSPQREGMSAFALKDAIVHHTYSTYDRGVEQLMGTLRILDLAPLGRNEEIPGAWWHRHDEYETRQEEQRDDGAQDRDAGGVPSKEGLKRGRTLLQMDVSLLGRGWQLRERSNGGKAPHIFQLDKIMALCMVTDICLRHGHPRARPRPKRSSRRFERAVFCSPRGTCWRPRRA
jgi:predicted dithiol-disulfide oxidoreductase (DUF899 family)